MKNQISQNILDVNHKRGMIIISDVLSQIEFPD